jgi:N-acetylmuramoyl-L-alanine amidase
MIIGLNIGHYGTKGAVGYLDEAECAIEIYNQLYPMLQKAGHTIISCNDATKPDYVSGTKIANKHNLDLVISIHLNSSENQIASGTEVLYYSKSSQGKEYAQILSRKISENLGTKNRGVKPTDNIYIIKNTKAPCVLLECLFVSNKEDCEKYDCKKIAEAVASCFGYKSNQELTNVNDIVWELSHIGIITDKELWLEKLQTDVNSYWLARKCVNYIRGIE